MDAKDAVLRAREAGKVIPAFNVPYLPMVEPIAQAVVDGNSIAMLQVARVEWEKFGSKSIDAVRDEYVKFQNPEHTLLHLDHVPVIDEDYLKVDYLPILRHAIELGYQSVMVDGSRLALDENIAATKAAVEIAHKGGVPCEAELGAVMGHESKELPPYEEIFKSKQGFTKLDEAVRFVKESECDWLSIACGNIHGAIAEATRDQKKPEARLDIDHIAAISKATGIPLVLHGGSGINKQCILDGIEAGIAKINVGTEIRQAYEFEYKKSGNLKSAQNAVYEKTLELITNFFHIKDTKDLLY